MNDCQLSFLVVFCILMALYFGGLIVAMVIGGGISPLPHIPERLFKIKEKDDDE